MRFRVIEIEEHEDDMIIRFCSVDEKGQPIVSGDKSWFIELWRPKTALVKVDDEFEITFTPIPRPRIERASE